MPSVHHRLEPYPVPQTLLFGIAGTEATGDKFSPPYALVVQGKEHQSLVAVVAEPGWHLWNDVSFEVQSHGLSVKVDLEGHTHPAAARLHIALAVVPAMPGETRLALLQRGMELLYPSARRRPARKPIWWSNPIYCGWGDQVTTAMWMEGLGPEPRALAYCLQGLYERWIRRLELASVPIGTVIIDAGWSPMGCWEPGCGKVCLMPGASRPAAIKSLLIQPTANT